MPHDYALGTTTNAGRRLALQDSLFADVSERLLDELAIQPADHVVELGTGAGSFSRRILHRLGSGGVLVGIDYSQGLLDQAAEALKEISPARVELVLSDIRQIAVLVSDANVVVARIVLHHLDFPEALLGNLHRSLRPGTRLGFIEPEFRVFIGRIAREEQLRPELAPLRRWAQGITRYYQACQLAPTIGATLGRTLEAAGYRNVRSEWSQSPSDPRVIENMFLFYDEIRDKYLSLGIMTGEEIDRDKELLAALSIDDLPPVWGMYAVTCVV